MSVSNKSKKEEKGPLYPNPNNNNSGLDLRPEDDTKNNTMSSILNDDDKLIFNLKILGTLQKYEKLTERDALLSVDDRWAQSVRRWYNGDNRNDICDAIFRDISVACARVKELMDKDYSLKRYPPAATTNEKKHREVIDQCRTKIQEFFLALSAAKGGIENQRETYEDKFSQTKLNLTLDKLNATVEKLKTLSTFEYR